MIIHTERLMLREMTPDDFDAIYAVLADSDIMQHYPYTFDDKRVHDWINRNIERYRIFGFGLWAVVLRESGEVIGDCGLTMQNINGQIKPEIGYHIRKDQQRKGYASEAARVVRDWSFANTPFRVLHSYMKSTNVASAATARANGMTLIEEFDAEKGFPAQVYAITREEWVELNNSTYDDCTDDDYDEYDEFDDDYISDGKYTYYSVVFRTGGKSYYYIGEPDRYSIGDDVIVPVGEHRHEKTAQIVDIEQFAEEDVPFPLCDIKIILRPAGEEDPKFNIIGELDPNEKVWCPVLQREIFLSTCMMLTELKDHADAESLPLSALWDEHTMQECLCCENHIYFA